MYAASLKKISYSPAVLGIFYAIQQVGAQGGFYAALVGNLGNFKLKHRGSVVGILVSMYGLSAFMVSQLYTHVFDSYPPSLFLFMSIFTFALCVAGACAIRTVKPYSSKGKPDEKLRTVAVITSEAEEATQSLLSDQEEEAGFPSRTAISNPDDTPTNIPRYGQLKFLSLLKHPDFWIVAATSFLTAGSGLTFITVVGSVAQSWKLTEAPNNWQASTFTSVLSICNCLGRIIYGVSQDALRKHMRSVTFLLPISIVISLAHFMMIFWMSAPALMLGAIFTGLSYGGFFATINVIINKYFGDQNYSSNLGFNTLVISVSGLIWGQAAGGIYDHFAINRRCYGAQCYRYIFMITSSLCLISAIVTVFLIYRERRDDARKAERDSRVN
jgi:MFS family permease